MGGMFTSSQTARLSILRPPVSDADTNVVVIDGAGNNATPFATLATLPSGVSINISVTPPGGVQLVFTPAFLAANVAGSWSVSLASSTTADPPTLGDFQWGGIADLIELTNIRCEQLEAGNTVFDGVVNTNSTLSPGGTVFQSVEAARVALFNKIEVDATDPANVILILYADDGVTPMATRTISNGDGSNVSLAQVLNLGTLQ